jgi:hypothetical protein
MERSLKTATSSSAERALAARRDEGRQARRREPAGRYGRGRTVLSNHAYAVVGADPSAATITVRDPQAPTFLKQVSSQDFVDLFAAYTIGAAPATAA